ncbi:hypothetical protein D6D01_02312 [Aureobasidium pullulans]|uniref:Uncharacterized protein n=1 Tax=Aureobasidium pullulans TaxID=5580 RepID=A0A4V4JXJ9_AURPU|nr:hypothetical protein D6D01_02312 [Aureobasidium pullulans]
MNNLEGLPTLQNHHDLWYKIHVLLYDLCNIATDRTSESRTLATTDELYISAPYFTPSEAALIKSTRIPPPTLSELPEFENLEYDGPETATAGAAPLLSDPITFEEAIKGLFGIAKEELKDEKFLSRLRRSGLPRSEEEVAGKKDGQVKKGGKRGSKKR